MSAKKNGAAPQLVEKYCAFKLEVRPSKIHRKVIEYTGEKVSRREGKRRAEANEIHCLFTINSYWYLDGAVGGSGAEYMNHCCEPNCESRVVKDHILYYSLRPIRKGEELTLDYHFGKDQERVKCGCGAGKCRGVINVLK
jgi:uncharacterized protein